MTGWHVDNQPFQLPLRNRRKPFCNHTVVFTLNKPRPDISDVLHKGVPARFLFIQEIKSVLQLKDLLHVAFS
jgi:hypothetical protein